MQKAVVTPGAAPVTQTTDTGATTAATTDATNSQADPAAATAVVGDGTQTVDTTAAATTADPAAAGDNTGATAATTTTDTTNTDDAEAEAKALEYLRKKTGKDLKSIDELIAAPAPAATQTVEPTEEEKAKQLERFQADTLQFGLGKGLFTPKELEAYNADKSRSPREIAQRLFAAEQLAADPELAEMMKTDREQALNTINDRFEDAYHLNEEESDWRRVRAQRLMDQQASNYINNTYDKVIGASDAYEAEIRTQQKAVEYKAKVENVVAALPTELTAEIEGEMFTYKIPDTNRAALRDQFLSTDTFTRLGDGAIEEADLGITMQTALERLEWKKASVEFAKAYASKMIQEIKLGRKGIPVTLDAGGTAQAATITGQKSLAAQMQEEAKAKGN